VLAVRAGLDKERYAVQDERFEDDRTVVVNFDRSYFLPDQSPAAFSFTVKALARKWSTVLSRHNYEESRSAKERRLSKRTLRPPYVREKARSTSFAMTRLSPWGC
jgi:hypothetical protein